MITLDLAEMFEAGTNLHDLLSSPDFHLLLLRNPHGVRLRYTDPKQIGHTSYVIRIDWAARVAPPSEIIQ